MKQKFTKMLRVLMFSALMLTCLQQVFGQGVTTATIRGSAKNAKGESIPGASISAVHTSSGTRYGITSNEDGIFTIPNMRIGGPYTITCTFLGYNTEKIENVFLSLDEEYKANFSLTETSTQLGEIVIEGKKDDVFNSNKTGASTTIHREQLEQMPTITRSFQDFTRLIPQSTSVAGSGGVNSFAGRNTLHNNVTIDGALFNNVFGLSGAVGGQTNAQPISLDAIEQISVSIAPYDVRQGAFTGASVNAVTRSGTNEFSGSAFYNFRNQSLLGTKINGTTLTNQNFNVGQYGFRLGGPIVKDKVFFFINAESERRSDPATAFVASRPGLSGPNVSSVKASTLDSIRTALINNYHYDPGMYENYNLLTSSDKATAKIDWNINDKNHFDIKYNFLQSYRDILPSNSANGGTAAARQPSSTGLPFSNTNYRINNNMSSIVAELNSQLGTTMSNNFTIGYTAFRDFRQSLGGVFPLVDIMDGSGHNLTAFGYEPFTVNNILSTDAFQVSDNFTMNVGKHKFTFGTSDEFYTTTNGFAPDYYGAFTFNSLANFNSGKPDEYQLQYSAQPGGAFPFAILHANQLSAYAQDDYAANDRLKLTLGLRVDVPMVPTTGLSNADAASKTFVDNQKVDVSKFQATSLLFSPRFGFNWDVNGDKTFQVRGGSGVFTGRVPFVWISNQLSNNGVLFGSLDARGTAAAAYTFSSDVNKYIPANATASPSYNLAVTSPNFKFPQVWRTNIAVDKKIFWDMTATVELIYTKDLNAVYDQNINLPNAPYNETGTGDNRAIYYNKSGAIPSTAYRINPTITNAILMLNTDKGYAYSATIQLEKSFNKQLFLRAAYNYGVSMDVNSGGSIAATVWSARPVVGSPNADVLGYSDYDKRHRILASATWKFDWTKNFHHFATSIGVFYNGEPGAPFSYVYAGDMNGDGVSNNDLIYIPKDQNDISLVDIVKGSHTYTAAQQWSDLDAYIKQDPYLNSRRGQYAERNGEELPWTHRIDFRLTQDFFVDVKGKKNTIELTGDIFNLTNLFGSNLGTYYTYNRNLLLTFNKTYDAQGRPQFTYPYLNSTTFAPLNSSFTPDFNGVNSLASRFQIQFGVRYIFN